MSDGQLEYLEDQTDGLLGRNVVWHDPANRNYPARGVLFGEHAPIVKRAWWARHVFDQGQESSCTAQAAAGCLLTSPNRIVLPRENLGGYDEAAERYTLYREAQRHDPWEGEAYEGSSTDAPFKVLRARGAIKEWRWCFGLEDVLRALSHHGPVAIGTHFYSGMDEALGPDGLVEPTGDHWGGHAYELYAVIPDDRYAGGGAVDWLQSWGPRGPRRGRYRMSWQTLGELLNDDGEAVTVVVD